MAIPSLPKSFHRGASWGRSVCLPRFVTKILYRALGLFLTAIAILCATLSAAQETPEVVPLEKQIHQKKDLGPRALGLLQMTANGKATLLPIVIMINGKFYDATTYKAQPVPMALYTGTVYEGERAGKSIGLFTISGALHSVNPAAPSPWLGAGSWLPAGAKPPETTHKAESVPRGLEEVDEGPPRLTKNSAATPTSSTPAPSSSPSPSATPASPSAPENSKPANSAPPAGSSPQATPPANSPPQTSTPSQASAPSSAPPSGSIPPSNPNAPSTAPKPEGQKTDNPKPEAQKSNTASQPSSPSAAESDSGASESGRPVLRRGKPTQALPDEDDVPGYTRVNATGAVSASSSNAAKKPDSSAFVPTELVPAISDAGGPQPHAYTYDWFNNDEERDRLKQMLALAAEQLNAYLNTKAKDMIAAQPSGTQPGHRKASAAAKDPVFENVKMRTFDLWNNNQPVLVLTAEAHFAPAPGATTAPATYSLTIAARTDIYSKLNKLYAGITDKYHLDVTPRLELIDAVDADGDGRGELLFRETSDIASGYVIYRATADSLWKMYDSLNQQ